LAGRAKGTVYGRRPVVELLRTGRPVERVLIAKESGRAAILGEIRRLASDHGVPVRFVPRAELDGAAGGANHQGVLAVTTAFRYTPLDRLLTGTTSVLFVDGVTDPHNLGSLLRSADGAGFSGIVIPARRSSAVTDTVRRVSAGAGEVVPVARVANLASALDEARAAGLWTVGLDASADTALWESPLLDPPVALVAGSEDRGLSAPVRGRCDGLVSIPQAGRLGSLNVAVATAIAMFEVARRAGREG
jgi:23S rRNA (guanosine2251-2'-O)-methyltransferase